MKQNQLGGHIGTDPNFVHATHTGHSCADVKHADEQSAFILTDEEQEIMDGKQGATVKRDAWPDVMNMHQYVLEVVDTMTPKEKGQWSDLMKKVGGEVFLETPVARPVVIQKAKQPYQFVLGPKKA